MPIPIMAGIGLALEFAPDIIRWISGDNAGDVAEKVAETAMKVTGTNNVNAAHTALSKDPKLVAEFNISMQEMKNDLEKAYLADRQDARARDEKFIEQGRENWRANIMLAMAFVFAGVIYSYLALVDDLAQNVAIALGTAGGMALKMIGDAFQFEFGSSRGSKNKDNILSNLKNP